MKVYRSHDVEPFPGGMFLELAERQDKLDFYLQECERIGYRLVEVSDNVARIPPDRRSSIIELAREEFGFKILNEVGSKKKISDFDLLAEDVEVGQQVGAWKTLVEAAEFFEKGNGFSQDLAKRLTGKVSPKGLIFELPGRWIEGVHSHQIYQMTDWLFDYFGPEVNIGNVAPAVLLQVEAIRQGVGPSMKF